MPTLTLITDKDAYTKDEDVKITASIDDWDPITQKIKIFLYKQGIEFDVVTFPKPLTGKSVVWKVPAEEFKTNDFPADGTYTIEAGFITLVYKSITHE